MAIVLEEKQPFHWGALLVFLAAIIVVVGAAYFLFFSPSPAAEEIIPLNVKSTTELSTVVLSPNDVLQNKTFQILKPYGAPAAAANPGANLNPFLKP
ncbi:MAG: hypothetical protein KGI60_00105 [Patescibacteria group bacterium]|nr:hypothetical protein [Patescibacteria group bacterium]